MRNQNIKVYRISIRACKVNNTFFPLDQVKFLFLIIFVIWDFLNYKINLRKYRTMETLSSKSISYFLSSADHFLKPYTNYCGNLRRKFVTLKTHKPGIIIQRPSCVLFMCIINVILCWCSKHSNQNFEKN